MSGDARLGNGAGDTRETTAMKKIKLDLGGVDGNAFCILGAFGLRARRDGWTKEEISAVCEKATAGDYAHLVTTIAEYCEDEE